MNVHLVGIKTPYPFFSTGLILCRYVRRSMGQIQYFDNTVALYEIFNAMVAHRSSAKRGGINREGGQLLALPGDTSKGLKV